MVSSVSFFGAKLYVSDIPPPGCMKIEDERILSEKQAVHVRARLSVQCRE